MKTDRRRFLSTFIAGGATTAAFPSSSLGNSELAEANYAKLDEVLARPVFKKELFSDAVIIESVELLRFGRSFLCRVRSKDGAEGISVSHSTMNVLYPIFVRRVQPVFLGQDARRLDDLLEKAMEYSFNYRLGGLGLGGGI